MDPTVVGKTVIDCAVAICYESFHGILSSSDLSTCEVLHTGSHKVSAQDKVELKASNLDQFRSVIKQIPHQLGDPDNIDSTLSVSLNKRSSV